MEIIIFIFISIFYFLPTIIGWNKRNSGAILILNLLLGWTVIGWIVALIWAFTNDPQAQQIVYVNERTEQKEIKNQAEKTYTKEELKKMLENMED